MCVCESGNWEQLFGLNCFFFVSSLQEFLYPTRLKKNYYLQAALHCKTKAFLGSLLASYFIKCGKCKFSDKWFDSNNFLLCLCLQSKLHCVLKVFQTWGIKALESHMQTIIVILPYCSFQTDIGVFKENIFTYFHCILPAQVWS